MLLSAEEAKQRKLSEKLRETNAELENINWISTHDLQEPLRKIQFISSMLLEKETENVPKNVLDALDRMNKSASRMQTLLIDILKFTKIKYAADAFEQTDLNVILTDVIEDIRETLKEKNAQVNTDTKLPVVHGVPFLLKQLFSNIILNSLKYSAADRPPVINITAYEPESSQHLDNRMCHGISFSDNGIGFAQQYAETIFNIFARLHHHNEYKGSGVGLALCKKIMQTHDGTITASGKPGEGAVFTIYFPCENE
ncbi:sensor histidine kinase [Flavobacterium sp. 3HN19-14]|uniref:sensor histidine kinase n=1 Tax=Flavobacterium sp. 3HN19-14 TaxID=3448133 RepID=UPI003EE06044